MDQAIIDLLKGRDAAKKIELNHENGQSRWSARPAIWVRRWRLNRWPIFTGPGLDCPRSNSLTIVLPVLMSIEEAILDSFKAHPTLTDGLVLSSLDRLCMSPEAKLPNDPLGNMIQFAIRLTLSLNDFSRQDVRHCLRKVKQSAIRHNKLAGTRGYLTFIRQQLDVETQRRVEDYEFG